MIEKPPSPPIRSRLAERCRDAIRAEILRGRWTGGLPSQQKLGREFQVSPPTLRSALHLLRDEGLLLIRKGKPTRILTAKASPAKFADRRPEVVLLHDAHSQPDPTGILLLTDRLHHELHRLGHGLVVFDAMASGQRGLARTLAAIDSQTRPSYYIAASVPPEVHRWLQQRSVPVLVVGSRSSGSSLPAIDIAPEATMRHAVQYLVRRGHRRLGLFMPPLTAVGAQLAHRAFLRECESMRADGVTGFVRTCRGQPDPVRRTARDLLLQRTGATAVIASGFELLVGLYAAASELRLRIPEDISVLTTQDFPILDYFHPRPTCYAFSWDRFARHISKIVDDHLRLGIWLDRFVKLLPTLREGESVKTLTNGETPRGGRLSDRVNRS